MSFKPNKVVLHCSATKDYPLGHPKIDSVDAAIIRGWHVNENGWQDIGYHFVIKRSGGVEIGRKENVQGAHAYGLNSTSFGVCLIGNNHFTYNQIQALLKLYAYLYKHHKISWDHWKGHYEVSDRKSCPNVSMEVVRELLRKTHRTELNG